MVVIKRILCPIDLSEYSPHVVDRAVSLARAYGASICALHVLPAAAAAMAPVGPVGPSRFAYQPVDREQVSKDVARVLALDRRDDVTIDVHLGEASAVHKAILAEAERIAADLIVLGTHGRSGFDRLIFGSVAEKILRTSPLPVMTVPPQAPDTLPTGREFQRILYTTDFSPGSAVALRYAASLAQHAAAQLISLHVVEPAPESSDPMVGVSIDLPEYERARQRQAAKQLQAAIPERIRLGCDTADVVTPGRPFVEILRVAAETAADLIVMSVHGRNAVDRLVFGSTTEQVLRRATCPVLTIRAADGHGR